MIYFRVKNTLKYNYNTLSSTLGNNVDYLTFFFPPIFLCHLDYNLQAAIIDLQNTTINYGKIIFEIIIYFIHNFFFPKGIAMETKFLRLNLYVVVSKETKFS